MPTTLNCPQCGAPLDPSNLDGTTIRCPYCGNVALLTEEVSGRPAPMNSGGMQGAFAPMIGEALKVAEIKRLVERGYKIDAIKLYRETFGVGLKEAKDAVERLGAGQPIVMSSASFQSGITSPGVLGSANVNFKVNTTGKHNKNTGCIVAAVIVLFVGFVLGSILLTVKRAVVNSVASVKPNSKAPFAPQPASNFAVSALQFGSEGIGAGQFKDARSVAVDGNGRIYVGEYTGGRVQVFDQNGKFLTLWTVDPKAGLVNLAADRKGTVYVVESGHILKYEGATGNQLGEVVRNKTRGFDESYSDVAIALGGSLYAISGHSYIVQIGPDGVIKRTIDAADKVGESVYFDRIAVSGSGEIYALDNHDEVFRFSPDGHYVNRFGGRGSNQGEFMSANAIAVDGNGRVYVSDSGKPISVFDNKGRFVDSFGPNKVVFGISIDDKNEIFATYRNDHQIVKYTLNNR
jgi:DNA-directed RNA polymerase subunit RPC12/RpoP